MPPILYTTLLIQMKWTYYLLQPKLNRRMIGLAGIFLGLFVFYLVVPFVHL